MVHNSANLDQPLTPSFFSAGSALAKLRGQESDYDKETLLSTLKTFRAVKNQNKIKKNRKVPLASTSKAYRPAATAPPSKID